MRKKKHGEERIAACSEYLIDKYENFGYSRIMVEIGCGKGGFINETAEKNPKIGFIGIERIADAALFGLERAKAEERKNLRFIVGNAAAVDELFPPRSVERIYLNFSDPWPKAGHYKRRLTYRGFLERYKKILSGGGEIFLKTDNTQLFDFSLSELSECGFVCDKITRDLHSSEYAADNIMTEYERAFSEKGMKINRLEAKLQGAFDK